MKVVLSLADIDNIKQAAQRLWLDTSSLAIDDTLYPTVCLIQAFVSHVNRLPKLGSNQPNLGGYEPNLELVVPTRQNHDTED